MTPRARLLQVSTLFALVGVGGFIVGRWTRSVGEPVPANEDLTAALTTIDRPESAAATPHAVRADETAPHALSVTPARLGRLLTRSEGEIEATMRLWAQDQSLEAVETIVGELLQRPNSSQREFALRGLAQRWGELDFEGARAFAEAQTSDERVHLVTQAIVGQTRVDPGTAWSAYCEASNFGANHGFNAFAVVAELARQDADFAFQCVQDLEGANLSTIWAFDALNSVAAAQGRMDALGTKILGLPGELKSTALTEYWRHRGYYEGEQALATLTQTMRSEEDRRQAMASFFTGWGRYNGPEALEFIYRRLPEAEQVTYAPMAISEWIDHGDPDLVLEHLNSIPRDQLSDRAILGISSKLARLDGPTAAEWALNLNNERLQREALQDVVWNWSADQPEPMQEFLRSLESEDLRSSLAWTGLVSLANNGKLTPESLEIIELRRSNWSKRTLLEKLAASLSNPSNLKRDPTAIDSVRAYTTAANFLSEEERTAILAMLEHP